MLLARSGRLTRRTVFSAFLAVTVSGLAYASPSGQVSQASALKPGDPAPGIKAALWIKGAPVNSFRKGRIYVLEFWATWCGPCRASIPEVTKVAAAYKDAVTVIGVNVWEGSGSTTPTEEKEARLDAWVKRFVTSMGPQMDYTVCRDTRDGLMARTWLEAAGITGIPATIVVDREGRVAWIGHPLDLGKTLKAMVDGTFSLEQAAPAKASKEETDRKEEASRKEFDAIMKTWAAQQPPLSAAREAKDWKRLLELTEACERDYPEIRPLVMSYRLKALVEAAPEKAFAYMDACTKNGTFKEYYNAASIIAADPALGAQWYRKAFEYITKAAATPEGGIEEVRTLRFTLLLRLDPGKARKELEDARGRASEKDGYHLAQLARTLIREDGMDSTWYRCATDILEPLITIPNDRIMLGYDLALGYHKAGLAAKAWAARQAYLAALEAHGTDPATLRESMAGLEEIRKPNS